MYALSFDTLVESCLPFRPSGVEYIDSTSCWKMSAAEIRHSYLHTSGSFWCTMSQQLNVIHIYLVLFWSFEMLKLPSNALAGQHKTGTQWDKMRHWLYWFWVFTSATNAFQPVLLLYNLPSLGESEDINKGLPWGFKFRVRKCMFMTCGGAFQRAWWAALALGHHLWH